MSVKIVSLPNELRSHGRIFVVINPSKIASIKMDLDLCCTIKCLKSLEVLFVMYNKADYTKCVCNVRDRVEVIAYGLEKKVCSVNYVFAQYLILCSTCL